MTDIEDDTRTWDRLPDESAHKYKLFCEYLHITPSRSLQRLADQLAKRYTKKSPKLRQLKRYSTTFHWVQRANDFDGYMTRLWQLENEQAIIEMNKRQAEAGHFLQVQALEAMKKEDAYRLVAKEKHERFKLGVETERKARGEKDLPEVEHKGQVNVKLVLPKGLEGMIK